MRHFAITGIVTASWISVIFSGSLIRATPPSLRMSAGTRSSAITAQAPASSAIRACSASVTSMITPPSSISARPLLARLVPISAIAKRLARRRKGKAVPDATLEVDRRHLEVVRPDRDREEAVLRARADAPRVRRRTTAQPVQAGAAAAVDDVPDSVTGVEPLVAVVVARQDELDTVFLEKRNPAPLQPRIAVIASARVRRVMHDGDLPGRSRPGQLPFEPGRLAASDPVRVEEEELRIAEPARVVRPGHPEQPELVA